MKIAFLKYSALFFLIIFFIIGCEDDPATSNIYNDSTADSVEAEVHRLVNLHRTGMGLQALEWNEIITMNADNTARKWQMHIQ